MQCFRASVRVSMPRIDIIAVGKERVSKQKEKAPATVDASSNTCPTEGSISPWASPPSGRHPTTASCRPTARGAMSRGAQSDTRTLRLRALPLHPQSHARNGTAQLDSPPRPTAPPIPLHATRLTRRTDDADMPVARGRRERVGWRCSSVDKIGSTR